MPLCPDVEQRVLTRKITQRCVHRETAFGEMHRRLKTQARGTSGDQHRVPGPGTSQGAHIVSTTCSEDGPARLRRSGQPFHPPVTPPSG